MDSSRSTGHVEILLPCQTWDPARGSFMVHPMVVKDGAKTTKKIRNPSWDSEDPESEPRLEVFRSANHITRTAKGTSAEPHPESFLFAVDYGR